MPRPSIPVPARTLAAALVLSCAGCGGLARLPPVAVGYASHLWCDDVFGSGLEPETAFAERVAAMPAFQRVAPLMRRSIDPERREVSVALGSIESRARHVSGQGCLARPADEPDARLPLPAAPTPRPDPFGPLPVEAADPSLRAALQRALDGPRGEVAHRTKAVLVLQDGALVGERYAPGFGVDTPMLGFSATKTVTLALIGVLVRQGRLAPDQPVPLAAWQVTGDARRRITLLQLLRQTSGLRLEQNNSGTDFNAHLMYVQRDKAAAAAAAPLEAPPGTRWAYADGHYVLLSRLLRDAVGGSAEAVQRFAQAELFGPLGLRHAALDLDATGTGIGSSHLLASARDWARLGQLLLDDGRVAGRRLLPEGWVTMATTPTPDTGYGAGLWTNRRPGPVPGWGVPWGLSQAPSDAYFARGFMGQFVVVVPSRRVVLVRLAVSHQRGDDIAETDRIVGEVLAALPR